MRWGIRRDTEGYVGIGSGGVQDCVGDRFCIDPFPITEDLKTTDIVLESGLLERVAQVLVGAIQ